MRLQNNFLNLSNSLLVGAVLTVAAVGCSNDEPDVKQGTIDDLSSFAQNFIGMKMSSSKGMQNTSDAAINRSFRATTNSQNGRILGDSVTTVDTTYVSDPDGGIYYEPWVSCAVITETNNSDGSYTSIYDYGDGCEEGYGDYKYFMHGKYTQNYSYSNEIEGSAYTNAYQYNTLFDNYGGHYNVDSTDWYTDGSSAFEGYSTWDTLTQKFSGYYVFSDNTTYGYNGVVNTYVSSGKSTYDEHGSIVLENEYKYSDGDNFYHSVVTKPLVTDYTCNQNGMAEMKDSTADAIAIAPYYWIYVSGHEAVTFDQDGQSGSFEIDYGTGECDNIIQIIENGIVVEVDMGERMMNYIK